MKENLTFRDCLQIKEELQDILEALDQFITFKEILENADYVSRSEQKELELAFDDFTKKFYNLDRLGYICFIECGYQFWKEDDY